MRNGTPPSDYVKYTHGRHTNPKESKRVLCVVSSNASKSRCKHLVDLPLTTDPVIGRVGFSQGGFSQREQIRNRGTLCQPEWSSLKTAFNVLTRIIKSSQGDQFRTYQTSNRTRSSKVSRFLPLTCQNPVIPGRVSTIVGR